MVSDTNSQALTAPDLDVSTSVSLVQCPSAKAPSANISAATILTESSPQSPTITPHKEVIAQDPASYLGLVELSQRLQEAVAASEQEKSMLKDKNYQLQLQIKEESDFETRYKILEEENTRLKAELENAFQYGPSDLTKDMTRLLRKNDELEERVAKQTDYFEKHLAENKKQLQEYIGQQLAENARLLKRNDELEERLIGNKKEMQEYIQQRLAEVMQKTENYSEETTMSPKSVDAKIENMEQKMETYSQETTKSLQSVDTRIEKMEQKLDQKIASLNGYNLDLIKAKQMVPTPEGVIKVSRHISGPYIYINRAEMINHDFQDFLFIPMCVWGVDLSRVKTILIVGRGRITTGDWHKFVPRIAVINLKLLPSPFDWEVSCILED
ncbi:hypothetical protein FPQ18DRAFT_306775 [Pyronema domesticum]|nr:hypothetical protein FPQ18DRAFT_306775 [Pyronema domesticum]